MITVSPFGQINDAAGKSTSTHLITLQLASGVAVSLCDYGARVQSFSSPDKAGVLQNIVLGYPNIETYVQDTSYQGATCGRVANRIADGRFELNGKNIQLEQNEGLNHLHGGYCGVDKAVWAFETDEGANSVTFKLLCTEEHDGYPGNATLCVTYTLLTTGLRIEMKGKVDQGSVLNLVNHAYFNLSGDRSNTILDHELQVFASKFTPTDINNIPLGHCESVENTEFDFRKSRGLDSSDEVFSEEHRGYDTNFCIQQLKGENSNGNEVYPCAVLRHPESNRVLSVFSNMPGLQVYTGGYLDGALPIDEFDTQEESPLRYSGVALETQHYPNSVNQPNFPSPFLKANEEYCHIVEWRMDVY
ncbi:aldose epimerase family protein [Marinomonas balearica]|nr:aldose epimerase family protein [Marinomonas balearica]